MRYVPALYLAQDDEADEFLANDGFALLVGMVLDQQIPLEKAFKGPNELKKRLGNKFEAKQIAKLPIDKLIEAFTYQPAIHRFPTAMAERVQAVAKVVVEQYEGNADNIWNNVKDGGELLTRLRNIPGFGEQKAKIFMALLGKQFEIKPKGWDASSKPFSTKNSYLSVADVRDDASLSKVRQQKKDAKQKV